MTPAASLHGGSDPGETACETAKEYPREQGGGERIDQIEVGDEPYRQSESDETHGKSDDDSLGYGPAHTGGVGYVCFFGVLGHRRHDARSAYRLG